MITSKARYEKGDYFQPRRVQIQIAPSFYDQSKQSFALAVQFQDLHESLGGEVGEIENIKPAQPLTKQDGGGLAGWYVSQDTVVGLFWSGFITRNEKIAHHHATGPNIKTGGYFWNHEPAIIEVDFCFTKSSVAYIFYLQSKVSPLL